MEFRTVEGHNTSVRACVLALAERSVPGYRFMSRALTICRERNAGTKRLALLVQPGLSTARAGECCTFGD